MKRSEKELLVMIDDLIYQATHERSHYYVKSVLVECKKYVLSNLAVKPALQELDEGKLVEIMSTNLVIKKIGKDYDIIGILDTAKIICQRFGTRPVKVPEKHSVESILDCHEPIRKAKLIWWNAAIDEFYRLNPQIKEGE